MNIEPTTPKSTKRLIIALIISMAAFLIVLGGAIYLKAQSEQNLKEGLIEGCQKNGNPLRKTVRHILENEIKKSQGDIARSKAADLQKLFPGVTPKELQALIKVNNEKTHRQNDQRREEIIELHPVNCQAQYK